MLSTHNSRRGVRIACGSEPSALCLGCLGRAVFLCGLADRWAESKREKRVCGFFLSLVGMSPIGDGEHAQIPSLLLGKQKAAIDWKVHPRLRRS